MNAPSHRVLLLVCIGIAVVLSLGYLGSRSSFSDYLNRLAQRAFGRSDNGVNNTSDAQNVDHIIADLKRKRIIVGMGTSGQPERIEADDLMATFSLEEARNIAKLESLTEVRIRKSFVVPKGKAENLQFALGDDSLKIFSTLPNLEILSVSSDQITDDGIATLSSMEPLRELLIQSKSVSGTGILKLAKLTNLEKLTLYISDDAAKSVKALAKKLPNCKIEIYNPSTGGLDIVEE